MRRISLVSILALLLTLVMACTFTVQATPEELAAWGATATARAAIIPELPTITPQVAPCLYVKANIGRDGRKLYHTPDSPNYDQVVIDEARGEKIYCTEQDAIDAGWTMAGN
jgi:hypothetical protein